MSDPQKSKYANNVLYITLCDSHVHRILISLSNLTRRWREKILKSSMEIFEIYRTVMIGVYNVSTCHLNK